MRSRYSKYFVIFSTFTLLFSLSALAQGNKHSVDLTNAVQVGAARLAPGVYKLEWEGTGPTIQVSFQRGGKTVVTVPATLKTNDREVTEDAVVTIAANGNPETSVLQEIDFGHQKEAVVFEGHQGGM